ncbi:MAG: tetratricopeptide repeat protein, partial [Gammaproteobacteria bacterium]
MLQRSRTLALSHLGPHHPFNGYVQRSLARLYRSRGQSEAALAAMKQAVAVFRESLPADSVVLAEALTDAAADHLQLAERAQAEHLLREALAIVADAGLPERESVRRRAETLLAQAAPAQS